MFLSHCLLNHNVRYLGGAEREAGVRAIVDRYLADGIGICQMPCPEERAWGGVLKRRMLIAYGAGGTWRSLLVRVLFGPFMAHTSRIYQRVARTVAAEIGDYEDSGLEVVGVIGIWGSPSCGVRTTLDLPAALDVLRRCPLANLDRRMINEQVIRAHTQPGQGSSSRRYNGSWQSEGWPRASTSTTSTRDPSRRSKRQSTVPSSRGASPSFPNSPRARPAAPSVLIPSSV